MYWDNFIEKSGKPHKYIRKIPKKTGKGYNYLYPKDFKNPLKTLMAMLNDHLFSEGAYKDHKVTEINIAPNLYHSQSKDLYADIGASMIRIGCLTDYVKPKKKIEEYKEQLERLSILNDENRYDTVNLIYFT